MAEDLVTAPPFWDEACRHLKRRDRVLKRLIPQFGEARLIGRIAAFTTLAIVLAAAEIGKALK